MNVRTVMLRLTQDEYDSISEYKRRKESWERYIHRAINIMRQCGPAEELYEEGANLEDVKHIPQGFIEPLKIVDPPKQEWEEGQGYVEPPPKKQSVPDPHASLFTSAKQLLDKPKIGIVGQSIYTPLQLIHALYTLTYIRHTVHIHTILHDHIHTHTQAHTYTPPQTLTTPNAYTTPQIGRAHV